MVCILSMCYCVHIPAPDLISLCQAVDGALSPQP